MFEENGRSNDEENNNNNSNNIPPEILEFVKEYKFLREKAHKERPGFLERLDELISDKYYGTCEGLGTDCKGYRFKFSDWLVKNWEEIYKLLEIDDPKYRLSHLQIHRMRRLVPIFYYEEYQTEPDQEMNEHFNSGAYVYNKTDEHIILRALKTVYETKDAGKEQDLIKGLEPLHFVDLCEKYLDVIIDKKDKNYLSLVFSLINEAIVKGEISKICKSTPTKFYPTEELLDFLRQKMKHRKFF